MKHISKGAEPSSFQDWKKKNPNANWRTFSGSDSYQELKHLFLEEQVNLCCYCEIALVANGDAHIEHFKPQHHYPKDIFNIQNLFGCCKHRDSCGHKKDSDFFDELISPLNAKCHLLFTYTDNGKIIPIDENDETVKKTIDLLGLNCRRLKNHRKAIIRTLDSENLDKSYLQQSLGNCVDWYNGFYTVIKYVEDKLFQN